MGWDGVYGPVGWGGGGGDSNTRHCQDEYYQHQELAQSQVAEEVFSQK